MKTIASRSAFSLLESIAAIFTLLIAILLTFQLFHSATQYFRMVEERSLALTVAEQRLGEVRNWARTQNGWSGFPNGSDPLHPQFNIVVSLNNYVLASPSLELDSNYTERRELQKTCKQVTVQVSWARGSVELYSLVGDRGNRSWSTSNPLQINGTIPATVTAADSVSLSVEATDLSGAMLEDLFYSWYVEPVGLTGALATINPSRDGRTATLVNLVHIPNGTTTTSTGQCRVAVRTIYHGTEQWGYTPTINLAP